MGWIGCVRWEKFQRDFVSRTFALVRPVLHRVSLRQPNSPECSQIVRTHQNVSLGSNGVDRVCLLRKIPTRHPGTNFGTTSARFLPSFVRQPSSPECTQIVRNALKRQFRDQRGGLGTFIAKNSDATSWHEVLH